MDEKKDGVDLLREYAEGKKEKRFCHILHGHYGDVIGDCMRGTCAECEGGYLAALADRIEREREGLDNRLMPEGIEWPRFEDGEKACFGDRFELPSGLVGNVAKITLRKCEPAILYDGIGRNTVEAKRPKPQVFAADGLLIREGETVWYDGAEYVVDRVYTASDGDYSVDLEFGDLRSATNVWPQLIDHTPPDTQERIDNDATMLPRSYCRSLLEWGEAQIDATDDQSLYDAMISDLLRRQRELDGRKTGGDDE